MLCGPLKLDVTAHGSKERSAWWPAAPLMVGVRRYLEPAVGVSGFGLVDTYLICCACWPGACVLAMGCTKCLLGLCLATAWEASSLEFI